LKHFASPKFWRCYRTLPLVVRELADKNFDLLKDNPYHPSLHFKKIGAFRSVRVGTAYRALAIEDSEDLIWFWIGNHSEYDKIVS
jgi:hypothetical protein